MTALFGPARYLTAEELEPAPPHHRWLWTIVTAVEVVAVSAAVILPALEAVDGGVAGEQGG